MSFDRLDLESGMCAVIHVSLMSVFCTNMLYTQVAVPFFTQVSAVDHTASTVMCVLGLGDSISKQYGLRLAAKEVLPMLTPLLVLPSLSGQQFTSAMR